MTVTAGPGGIDASGGAYWNPIAGEAGGVLVSGVSSGVNIGVDRFFGFVIGPPQALEGSSINQNWSVGPLALTTFHSPQTFEIIGGTIGVGWSRYPIGYSTSFVVTHTICVTCRR